MKIMIAGLNKADVLLALYNNAYCEGVAMSHAPITLPILLRRLPLATLEDANNEIEKRLKSNNFIFDYVDFCCGSSKALKVDLGGDEFDSCQYDFYHGEGLAEKVINDLRAKPTLNMNGGSKYSIGGLLTTHNTIFSNVTSEEKKDEETSEISCQILSLKCSS